MSNSTAVTRKENDDIQVGVEVAPKITDDDNTGNNVKLTKENSDDGNNSCVPANNRNSFNLGRFPSSSSSPGSTPIKSAPSTPNRLFRSESSSSVIGLLPVAASQTFDNPPSPVTKVPPSPTTCVDAGPTVGVLEPEMFTGIETIVVPSEPDLVNYNSVELSTVGEERAKFQFSTNNNNVTFHRRFPQVDPDERLINYYSCALQADILLQGYLYITENYFAFYSNILGLYKTKLLVPVCDVRDITKEKTAIIIPNAVGIETPEGKYVFGSLLSRESTFRLMIEVWKNTISRGSFQLDTFPYDHLRPTQDPTSDNGNSSPSTPTKEDPLKTILPSASKREPGRLSITTLGPLESAVSKSSSLNRTKLIRRTKGGRQGFHHCTDSSTPETASDLDYGQEGEGSKGEVGQHRKSKSPFKDNQSSRRGKLIYDGWRRLSISIKSFRERLKSGLSTPFLHIAIIILLTYLLISTVCMIHRINLLRDLFESLTSNPQAQRILNNLQVEQIRLDLSKNMVKMDDLKSSLLHLLDSVEKVFNSNCANTKYNIFTNPSMLNTCPTKEK